MDGLTLLHQAHAAGLRVEVVGSMLKITGPKSAEPVVKLLADHKSAVLAALAPNTGGQDWSERYTARTFEWLRGNRSWNEARILAWGDLTNEWHSQHGRRGTTWQCAGCEQPIGGLAAIDLPDGSRVHDDIDCLIRFGRRWRGEAANALVASGLSPPEEGKQP